MLALALSIAACTPTDEPADLPPQDPAAPDTAMPGDRDPDPDLAPEPDIDLPEGWRLLTVPDGHTGAFQVGVPDDAVGWAVGMPLAPLEQVAEGTDWWEFWEPRLAPLEAEISNVRAMIAVPDDDEVHAVQVNVTPYDLDVEPDDARGIADAFATVAEAQGSEVHAEQTVAYDGPQVEEVAQVVQRVAPDVLARDVWQRFVPAPEADALWSVQCDGPVTGGPDADIDPELEARCMRVLATFRPPA